MTLIYAVIFITVINIFHFRLCIIPYKNSGIVERRTYLN